MIVIKAARFCIEAWKYGLLKGLVPTASQKLGVFGPVFGLEPRPKKHPLLPSNGLLPDDYAATADMYDMVSQLQRSGRIREAMQVENFLQPEDGVVRDSHTDSIASILEEYQPPWEE
jgi:hypothetical protein